MGAVVTLRISNDLLCERILPQILWNRALCKTALQFYSAAFFDFGLMFPAQTF
jgi:hypothetical protein